MFREMFAGIHVRDFEAARAWYERLLGTEPSFLAHETEAVWQLASDRSIFIEESPDRAGHSEVVVFVEDLDALVGAIAARGIEPAAWERYENGVRKALYRDPDGNEIGFGGGPDD